MGPCLGIWYSVLGIWRWVTPSTISELRSTTYPQIPCIQHPESRIQNPESSIQNPVTRIQNPARQRFIRLRRTDKHPAYPIYCGFFPLTNNICSTIMRPLIHWRRRDIRETAPHVTLLARRKEALIDDHTRYILCTRHRSLHRKAVEVCRKCRHRFTCEDFQKYRQPGLFKDLHNLEKAINQRQLGQSEASRIKEELADLHTICRTG
ncbi:hypothetical protein D3OALGA1CA_3545 [Olavius algarvensis associated proteobacterium Delta 3]|nr:hypothetical protein D3OALGA1CA_3545 [Olavius algarvensis associated proteobacterium Delta 3]